MRLSGLVVGMLRSVIHSSGVTNYLLLFEIYMYAGVFQRNSVGVFQRMAFNASGVFQRKLNYRKNMKSGCFSVGFSGCRGVSAWISFRNHRVLHRNGQPLMALGGMEGGHGRISRQPVGVA